MSGTIEACKFCGSNDQTVKHSSRWGYFVSCGTCHAVGPSSTSPAYAVKSWNSVMAERTCRIEYGPSAVFRNETGPDWTTQDFVARCSGCGHRMHQDPFTGDWPRYCIGCGARIMGMEDAE